ncbi:MAG: hypothetical protein QM534_15710 [Sediminibacterium sp.]|nr:hypothetical protein [Sediminibacterium sp.]
MVRVCAYVIVLAWVILSNACISPERCAVITGTEYRAMGQRTKPSQPQKVVIDLNDSLMPEYSTAYYSKLLFLPLFLYWQNTHNITVEPGKYITTAILSQKIQKGLEKANLSEQYDSIKISIKNYNNRFVYYSDYRLLVFGVYFAVRGSSKNMSEEAPPSALDITIEIRKGKNRIEKRVVTERKRTNLSYNFMGKRTYVRNFVILQLENENLWLNKVTEAICKEISAAN